MNRKSFILNIFITSLIVVTVNVGCNGKKESTNNQEEDSEESSWIFSDDNVSLGISGVSPEAILLNDGSVRLYVTDMAMKVFRADDGLDFTEEKAFLPQGSDPTLILLGDGIYRMYYVDHIQHVQVIWTATSPDGLNWTLEASTGISNTSGDQAWGVPDSVELPNGSIRLYWVEMPSGSSKYEIIKSAISVDGLVFTEESGHRTEDGYVDPYIMIAEEGNWIGLFATTPASERLPQKIYVGTSQDGLVWTIESIPVITVQGGNALDPTAVPLGDGSYRVYYSATSGSDPFSGHSLKSGILKRKQQ